jgi:hypothetical protein
VWGKWLIALTVRAREAETERGARARATGADTPAPLDRIIFSSELNSNSKTNPNSNDSNMCIKSKNNLGSA